MRECDGQGVSVVSDDWGSSRQVGFWGELIVAFNPLAGSECDHVAQPTIRRLGFVLGERGLISDVGEIRGLVLGGFGRSTMMPACSLGG
jgi:hypothetical protein